MDTVTMRFASIRLTMLGLMTCLGLTACASNTQMTNELRRTNADLTEARKQRDMLRAKVSSLYDEIERSRNQCHERYYASRRENVQLQDQLRECSRTASAVRRLEEENADLRKWSRSLVEGYGPGIWLVRDGHPFYDRKPQAATIAGITNELNADFGARGLPSLVLKKVTGRVVHVEVTEGARLATAMGSSGAADYLLQTLYSLASLPEIDCVDFYFQEGDHAAPGRQCP